MTTSRLLASLCGAWLLVACKPALESAGSRTRSANQVATKSGKLKCSFDPSVKVEALGVLQREILDFCQHAWGTSPDAIHKSTCNNGCLMRTMEKETVTRNPFQVGVELKGDLASGGNPTVGFTLSYGTVGKISESEAQCGNPLTNTQYGDFLLDAYDEACKTVLPTPTPVEKIAADVLLNGGSLKGLPTKLVDGDADECAKGVLDRQMGQMEQWLGGVCARDLETGKASACKGRSCMDIQIRKDVNVHNSVFFKLGVDLQGIWSASINLEQQLDKGGTFRASLCLPWESVQPYQRFVTDLQINWFLLLNGSRCPASTFPHKTLAQRERRLASAPKP